MTTNDADLRKNLREIGNGDCRALHVSAEHYTWLAGQSGTLLAIIDAAAGETIEGHPVSLINVIQRVRELNDFANRYSGTYESHRLGTLQRLEDSKP